MARKSVGLPTGLEIRNGAIRIRFNWQGKRCSETLPYTDTQAGIQAAARIRDQVIQLNKLGLLDEAKYAELFPNSYQAVSVTSTFGDYAQIWIDSKSISKGARRNYKSALNNWWMPHIALKPIKALTPVLMRMLTTQIQWSSSLVKHNAMKKLSFILDSAVNDGLIPKNPMDGLELPRLSKKKVDPFTQEEADRLIQALYRDPKKRLSNYGAFFEFAFYTGMRLGEILALKWSEIDEIKKVAFVCRVVSSREIVEQTKTNKNRYVLLNDRALAALEKVKGISTEYCFPSSAEDKHISETSVLHTSWKRGITSTGLRYRKPYSTRHTYATMCLMAGMNPAFIAAQLGHSVEMLLKTYAQWINTDDDWSQMAKLITVPKLPQTKEGEEER